MHLTEELMWLNLQRRSWNQKALARGKRTQWRILLKNMSQWVTREWVGEGELPKERTQSKMRRCLVRDAIMQRYDHHFDEQYNGKKGYGFKE
ncbi:hypothetical protein GW17_00020158 [Ensete ventricosum]|nr:hypothetical protein GW17_00020158 [Ensete ventricosum]